MPTKKQDFEKDLEALEKIVSRVRTEDLGLDEMIQAMEEGVKLYKKCRSNIEKAEKRIKILSDEMEEIDF